MRPRDPELLDDGHRRLLQSIADVEGLPAAVVLEHALEIHLLLEAERKGPPSCER